MEHKLANTVYIQNKNYGYLQMLAVLENLLEEGYTNFFFTNDAQQQLAYAVHILKRRQNVELFAVHGGQDRFYLHKNVTHLFVENGVQQHNYLKTFCTFTY